MREEREKPKSQRNASCQTVPLLETSCTRDNQVKTSRVAVTLLTRDTLVSLHIGLIQKKQGTECIGGIQAV